LNPCEEPISVTVHRCPSLADSCVGDEENIGISSGERKRVSIGVDMIHDPPILLLDEPTSSLDSISALQVIELLSSMAKGKERTVILSIHQPSYRILQYIKNFLILSCGSAVHNGSLESREETINKLGFQIPFQIPCDRICHGNYVYTRGFIFQKVSAY
jgi:ABC-type multidrug transport system ATPase subunit